MWTIYKDTYLSDWSHGINGSFVVLMGDNPSRRKEFKLVTRVDHLRDIPYLCNYVLDGTSIIAAIPDPDLPGTAFHRIRPLNEGTVINYRELWGKRGPY